MSNGNDSSDVQTSSRKPRKRRLLPGLIVLFLLLLAIGSLGRLFLPVSGRHRKILVTIPTGASAQEIGATLEKRGVIRSAWAFDLYLRWKERGKTLKAGSYAFSGGMTLGAIFRELTGSERRESDSRIRVTVPEGYTLQQVAELLGSKNVTDATEFLKLASSPESLTGVPDDFSLPSTTVEGYLFPDTYYFPPQTPPLQVIDTMLLNFSNRFVRPYRSEIEHSDYDLHTLVTEASLIEREAKVPQDRPRIAGVLDNRLKRGMRLQVDATVLYALGHHKNRVLYKDLRVNSPYNTYRYKGLPPGPIANPGLAALLAALRPEKHDFLYYVARPDGAHIFSRTPGEHEAAKRQARLERQQSEMEIPSGG